MHYENTKYVIKVILDVFNTCKDNLQKINVICSFLNCKNCETYLTIFM